MFTPMLHSQALAGPVKTRGITRSLTVGPCTQCIYLPLKQWLNQQNSSLHTLRQTWLFAVTKTIIYACVLGADSHCKITTLNDESVSS